MQNQNSSELDALAEELMLRREVDENGTIRYRNENNEVHRVHGPAVIWANGTKHWFQDNKRHRLDGPAIVWASGDRSRYIDGEYLSEAQFNAHPAVIAHKSKVAL